MSRLSSWVPAAVALGGMLSAGILARPPDQHARDAVHVPPLLARVELLHVLFAAQQNLIADYYWVRASEALGRANDANGYRDIYVYVKQVVDLDPSFWFAYVFGGTAVTYNLGREQWVNTAESTELLRRGVDRFPGYISARTMLAYNLSQFHHQFREAADLLAETAALPGAPAYLAPLAARLYARSGDIEAGIDLADALAKGSEDPHTREVMVRRGKELELEKVLRRVDAAAAEFVKREGRMPASVKELRERGFDLGELIDPFGGEIVFDNQRRAVSTASSDRMIVYGLDEGYR